MKRMLINATQEEELRMAMVDGQRLYDLNIELPSGERKKANIYKGKITRVEPSLEAAFVEYGADRHGFLPLKEVSNEYFIHDASGGKPNIREVLQEGQDIVVQIDKEERGNKGAALTTFISLAGRFIVLKPNKPKSGGVSRRIVGEDRDLARQSLKGVDIPDGMSVILRTAGIDRDSEELEWDLNNLLAIWEAIKSVVLARPAPFLMYRESNAIVRALRDYLTNEVGEILVDDEATYKEAQEFIDQVMPHNQRKLKHYTDSVPLFTRYQIESQIESAFAHNVNLPSGGSIVIDHTEALVAIDINSARATKGSDIEETAFQTNLEAADEVGRQLRLRDLGGLVVIDFIDMGPQKNQRTVETRLRESVRQDRARVQFGKISRFGLLEMSRQRLRPSLGESSYLTCPRCSGIGNIRSVESLALAILRLIGEEARKERTAKVIAQLPVEVATYLLNEKREWVQSLESRHEMQVILVANPLLETPHYQVRRVRDDQLDLPENIGTSFALIENEEEQVIPQAIQRKPTELAAVATVAATTPPPVRKEAVEKKPGLWAWIKGLFASDEEPERGKKRAAGRKPQKSSDGRSRGGQRNRRQGQSQKSGDGRKATRKKQASKKNAKKSEGKGSKRSQQTKSKDDRKSDAQNDKPASQTGTREGAEEIKTETRKTSGRRRSRGGRRRRRGGQDKPETAVQSDTTEQAATTGPDAAATVAADADVAAARPERTQEISGQSDAAVAAGSDEKATPRKPEKDDRGATGAVPLEATPVVENAPMAQQGDTATTDGEVAADRSEVSSQPDAALTARQEEKPVANEPKKDDRAATGAVTLDTAAAAVTEAPIAQIPAPAAKLADSKSESPDDDYEITQPSLPVLRPEIMEKIEARMEDLQRDNRVGNPAADTPKQDPLQKEAAESEAPPSVSKSDSTAPAASEGKPVETPVKDEEKPRGRLLPWEPQAAPPEQTPGEDRNS